MRNSGAQVLSRPCIWPAWWRQSYLSFSSRIQERVHQVAPGGPPPRLLDEGLGLSGLSPKEGRPARGTCHSKGGGGRGYSSPASRARCWKAERGSCSPPFKTLLVTTLVATSCFHHPTWGLYASLWSLAQGSVGWGSAGWPWVTMEATVARVCRGSLLAVMAGGGEV